MTVFRHALVAAPVIALLAGTALAETSARTARLSYTRGVGADDCPDEEGVRAGIAARLGYEPFDESAAELVVAQVSRLGNGLGATIRVGHDAGAGAAERRLTTTRGDCAELASAMELAIAMAIDPLGGVRPQAHEEEQSDPPPTPAAEPPVTPPPPVPVPALIQRAPAPSPPPRQATPFVARATVGAIGGAGIAPASSLGGTLQIALRRNQLSLGLEGRADLSATAPLRTGDISTSVVTGSLVPCVHRGLFGACALFSAGALRASGRGLVDARQVSIPFAAVGARVALDVPVGAVMFVRLHADLLAPLTETVLRVSGEAVWTSPSLSAALGLGIGARFL